VDQKFYLRDHLWNIGVRLNINRDNYKVPPALYAFGQPNQDSPVLVTGNYKLTFDYLRKYLKKDYWVLVVDTDGINVWCAAGKGRFGTAEIIRMLQATHLPVDHKTIILPQLGAPGVQSHLISQVTGRKVIYGPVRIQDMDRFIDQGIDEDMRQVTFGMVDRMKVSPLEFVSSLKWLMGLGILSLIGWMSIHEWLLFLTASLLGNLIFPILLPYLPFRAFYRKGLVLSLPLLIFYEGSPWSAGLLILAMAYTGYRAMNFTGSTTFTSLSGVKKEIDKAVPQLLGLALVGIVLILISLIGGLI